MNSFSIPLPVAVRQQGEIIGIVAGIACFPFALYAGDMEIYFPSGPTALVLPIVILTAIVGAIASLTADASLAPKIGGVSLRVGARAGFITSLVAGAITVLASTFHSLGIGTPTSFEFGWTRYGLLRAVSPSSRVIVLALLALPPSLFFGLIGSILAVLLKPKGALQQVVPHATVRTEYGAAFIVALSLTIACYLSPLLVFFNPNLQGVTPVNSPLHPW